MLKVNYIALFVYLFNIFYTVVVPLEGLVKSVLSVEWKTAALLAQLLLSQLHTLEQ